MGLGTEIVECARVRSMIEEHGERFLERIYTPDELRWCQSRKNATEQFAVVWAAKEAVFKCLRIASRAGSPWTQIEIDLSSEVPRARIRGVLRDRMIEAGVGGVMLTTAFTRHHATATAIALKSAGG